MPSLAPATHGQQQHSLQYEYGNVRHLSTVPSVAVIAYSTSTVLVIVRVMYGKP